MKKILLTALSALVLGSVTSSCVDSLDEYNIDPKRPTEVPAPTLFANAERELARTVGGASVNLNPFRLYSQYWAQTTYIDESQYDINTRSINRTFWNTLYRDVLRDLEESKKVVLANSILDAKVKANQLAAIEILEVYTWSVLVDTFGDIPYSQALDFNQPQPKYDDDKAIYTSLFARLKAATTALDASAGSFGDADLIYAGNVSKWIKFAASLRLRMAVTVADADAVLAQTNMPTANDVITANSENAQVRFLGAFPSTNPLFEDLVLSGRKDFVGTNTFIDTLKAFSDPRLDEYFALPEDTTVFLGGIYGVGNSTSAFSNPGPALTDPTLPGVLISAAEVEFLLAEAVERGLISSGTAADHYAAGIRASVTDFGNSTADADAYLAQPSVAYATALGDFKHKIGLQKWIALYNQPTESWKEWRRLDAPDLVAPADALTAIPLRFTYPVVEQNLNTSNYNAAANAIGGDKVTTKIFWDKF